MKSSAPWKCEIFGEVSVENRSCLELYNFEHLRRWTETIQMKAFVEDLLKTWKMIQAWTEIFSRIFDKLTAYNFWLTFAVH